MSRLGLSQQPRLRLRWRFTTLLPIFSGSVTEPVSLLAHTSNTSAASEIRLGSKSVQAWDGRNWFRCWIVSGSPYLTMFVRTFAEFPSAQLSIRTKRAAGLRYSQDTAPRKLTITWPGHIQAVQMSRHPVIWVCDPMHGKYVISLILPAGYL